MAVWAKERQLSHEKMFCKANCKIAEHKTYFVDSNAVAQDLELDLRDVSVRET